MRWFNQLEDDGSASQALSGGVDLIDAAKSAGLIDREDVDGFAALVIACADDGLIAFDCFMSQLQHFGQDPGYDLQQATNFRSTNAGRQWVEGPNRSASITVSNSRIGQLAGGDIHNVTLVQLLDAVADEIDRVPAQESERKQARQLLDRIRDGVDDVAAGAGAGVLAQAVSRALGIS